MRAEDDDEPYSDPAHWYEDDDDMVEQSAYPYWEEEDEEVEKFTAYISEEWSKKYSDENMADTALETAELDCAACLQNSLGSDCFEDPDVTSEFIQSGTSAFMTGR